MGLEFVAIIGQWLQLIKITRPGLQCSKSQQQTFRLIHILKYLSVVDTAVCPMLYYVQYFFFLLALQPIVGLYFAAL